MKMNWQGLLLGVVVAVAGCGGEGSRRVGQARCPESYNPVPMKVKDQDQKINAKANEFEKLPAGTYKYAGAALYYTDKARKIKIHLMDKADKKDLDGFSPKVTCLRNYLKLQGMNGLEISANGVTDFEIDENHKTKSFDVKEFSFKIENGQRQDKFSKTNAKPGSFKEVYDIVAEEAFILHAKGTRYQIRSFYPGDKNRGDVYLLIYLDYSKPSP